MAPRGKSINVYLMDGNANGRIKCTLANWTGVAYKIPRTDLEKCKDREDLKQSGVYFLFGTSDETGKGVVYIGQAGARKNGEGILNRLLEHKRNPQKDYWTEAIVFTTSNNSFGPTEISYLENRFCNLAIEANRYDVKNENDPTSGHITEEKESELEEFIDNAKIIMGTLGHKVFEPKRSKQLTDNQDDITNSDIDVIQLHLKRDIKGVGLIEADGCQTADGFVVLAGSQISPNDDDTIPASIKESRSQAPINDKGILQEDMLFTSPSYAAMFVIGKSENGLTRWRTQDGRTLKSLESGDDNSQTNNLPADEKKKYKLLGADGEFYESETPGKFGGNSKLKVYGKLDCGSARSTIKRFPGKYEEHRVFFADEKTALEAGYRPCGNCLREKYKEYMADPQKYREKIERESEEAEDEK